MFIDKDANLLRLTVRDDPQYVKHLEALKQAQAIVDAKPPIIWLSPLLKNKRDEYCRMKRVTRDNENLLENINKIQRSKGQIDSHNPSIGHHRTIRMTKLLEQISKIEKDNKEIYKRFMRKGPTVINNQDLKKSWRINVAKVRGKSRYNRAGKTGQNDENLRLLSAPDQNASRTQIFIEFTVENGLKLGCVKVVLFDDIVPKLVLHFLSGLSQIVERREQHGKATSIQVDRIFSNLYAEFTMPKIDNDNSMEELEADEYGLSIDCPGALAMIPTHDNQFSSKYALTFKPLSVLNGIFTVFGRVYGSRKVLELLEGWGRKHGTPIGCVYISNCRIVN